MNVLRNLLTVCGEVLVSFLGDGSRELGRIAIVGSTFQAGVISSVGKLRVVESASFVWADASQAYIQNPGDQHASDDDFGDDPTIDDMPHYVPEPEGLPIGLRPVLLQNTTDSDTSDEERFPDDFSSSSVSSIEPSEPEHEPSFELSASASSSSGVDGLRASIPICYGQNQYRAEEECLLVVYVDDVLRVPLPGWPREDIQAIVQGLSGDWTTFSAIIERDRPPQEALPSLVLEPLAELSTETVLALENVAAPVTEEAHPLSVWTLQQHLLLGLGAFNGGIVLGGTVVAVVVWVESVELGPTSWVVLAGLGSVLYRSVRAVLVLLWGGLSALPSALGFVTEPGFALQSWTSGGNLQVIHQPSLSCTLVVWLMLIILFGLANPSEATGSIVPSEHDGPSAQYGLVVSPGAICRTSPLDNPDKGYGGWWLLLIGCMVCIVMWETLKWAVCFVGLKKQAAESGTQTEVLPVVHHPLPEGVKPLSRVLYALWRADLSIPIELYPEEVQYDFHSLVGAHLCRLNDGEDSSE